jgi:chemotaxis protein MotB
MAAKDRNGGNSRPVLIRKEEIVEGGHHGGAWKVAYADFVTAMMAFFLLMWLLNATTEAQRKGLADYFAPASQLSRANSGAGLPLGGKSAFETGDRASDRGANTFIPGRAPPPLSEQDLDGDEPVPAGSTMDGIAGKPTEAHGAGDAASKGPGDHEAGGGAAPKPSPAPSDAAFLAAAGSGVAKPVPNPTDKLSPAQQAARERAAFEQAAHDIREAVARDPALAALARQLAIDITPEGLRIQMLDEDNQPMFATGSSVLNGRARTLVGKIVPALARLEGAVSIAGYTDAAPFRGIERSNWELSSERAHATRRLLIDAGLPEARFRDVTGHADRDLLLPADPLAAANRRIAIVVLRAAPATH